VPLVLLAGATTMLSWPDTLWRLMMHPMVQSFHAPNGVIASALAS
jgi:hypothetical protein